MKRYIVLGIIIFFIGVLAARVWVSSIAAPCPKDISSKQLATWIIDSENTITDVYPDYLYVQEAIGSTAVELKNPQLLKGEFKLQFQLLSLTQTAKLYFKLQKENDIYEIEMNFSANHSTAKLSKNNLFLLEKEIITIKPNIYYGISIEQQNNLLTFSVNENKALSMSITPQPVQLSIKLVGQPDNPAAFELRDMQIIPLP